MEQNIDTGYTCPHCQSYVRQYTRKFNSNMGTALMALYKHKVNGFVKVEDFLLTHGYKRCGDFSYMVHYRLIEKQEGKRKDNSKRTGYYKITSLGIMFCELKWKVQEKFIILNNKLMGFAGEEVTIKDVLSTKFNYEEMMSPPSRNQHKEEVKEEIRTELKSLGQITLFK